VLDLALQPAFLPQLAIVHPALTVNPSFCCLFSEVVFSLVSMLYCLAGEMTFACMVQRGLLVVIQGAN